MAAGSEGDSIPPLALRVVESGVGARQERLRREIALLERGEPDGDRHRDALLMEHGGVRLDEAPHLLREERRLLERYVGEEQRQLLATHPREELLGAHE